MGRSFPQEAVLRAYLIETPDLTGVELPEPIIGLKNRKKNGGRGWISREYLQLCKAIGLSNREIARQIGCGHQTIGREINYYKDKKLWDYNHPVIKGGSYNAQSTGLVLPEG